MTTLTQTIATDLIKKCQISFDDLETDRHMGSMGSCWNKVYPEVRKMKPSLLGIISCNLPATKDAISGKWSLDDVLGEWDFTFNKISGRDTLRMLATAALLSIMHKILEIEIMENCIASFNQDELYIDPDEDREEEYEPQLVHFTEGPCGHHGYE